MRSRTVRAATLVLIFIGTTIPIFSSAAGTGSTPAAKYIIEKVVYHVDDMSAAREALFNIENQLAASPKTKISLVANGKGIYLLVSGEKDKYGEYLLAIQRLSVQGVHFLACNNSMKSRNIPATELIKEAEVIPSGVVELTRMQLMEQFAYIKP